MWPKSSRRLFILLWRGLLSKDPLTFLNFEAKLWKLGALSVSNSSLPESCRFGEDGVVNWLKVFLLPCAFQRKRSLQPMHCCGTWQRIQKDHNSLQCSSRPSIWESVTYFEPFGLSVGFTILFGCICGHLLFGSLGWHWRVMRLCCRPLYPSW